MPDVEALLAVRAARRLAQLRCTPSCPLHRRASKRFFNDGADRPPTCSPLYRFACLFAAATTRCGLRFLAGKAGANPAQLTARPPVQNLPVYRLCTDCPHISAFCLPPPRCTLPPRQPSDPATPNTACERPCTTRLPFVNRLQGMRVLPFMRRFASCFLAHHMQVLAEYARSQDRRRKEEE